MDDVGNDRDARICRLPEVIERTGMSRSWLYAEISAGRFPHGIRIGARARGWTALSINHWINRQLNDGVR
jgi:prophage regulatory protein